MSLYNIIFSPLHYFPILFPTPPSYHPVATLSTEMAPKPASTAGKAPVASKAPVKTTSAAEGKKKPATQLAEGEKKKRKKVRKETYSSYIYKGSFSFTLCNLFVNFWCQSSSRSIPIQVSPTRPWQSLTVSSMISSNGLPLKRLVSIPL